MKVRFRIFMVTLSVCSQYVFYSNWLNQVVTFLYHLGKFYLQEGDAEYSSKNLYLLVVCHVPKIQLGTFTYIISFSQTQSKLMEKLKAKCKCISTLMKHGAGSWQSCRCLSLVFPVSLLLHPFLNPCPMNTCSKEGIWYWPFASYEYLSNIKDKSPRSFNSNI